MLRSLRRFTCVHHTDYLALTQFAITRRMHVLRFASRARSPSLHCQARSLFRTLDSSGDTNGFAIFYIENTSLNDIVSHVGTIKGFSLNLSSILKPILPQKRVLFQKNLALRSCSWPKKNGRYLRWLASSLLGALMAHFWWDPSRLGTLEFACPKRWEEDQ